MAAEATDTGKHTILVIDDDPTLVMLISGVLGNAGIEVCSCGSGREAAPLAPQARAILCDFHLPQENGALVVAELRRAGFQRPIIMMTGDRRRSVVESCVKAGITDFLPKPFTNELLLSKLGKYVSVPQPV